MSEIDMHYGEALAWIRELEAFIGENGLEVPTWADREAVGLQPEPVPIHVLTDAVDDRPFRRIISALETQDEYVCPTCGRPQHPGETCKLGHAAECTCRPNNYDGDDGWERDCPQHGVEANHA